MKPLEVETAKPAEVARPKQTWLKTFCCGGPKDGCGVI